MQAARRHEGEPAKRKRKITVELEFSGNSVVVQWLELSIVTSEGPGSIPGNKDPVSHKARNKQTKYLLLYDLYKLF